MYLKKVAVVIKLKNFKEIAQNQLLSSVKQILLETFSFQSHILAS